MKKTTKKVPAEEREKIVSLLKEHRSIKKVMEISGRSKTYILRVVKKDNLKMKGSKIPADEEKKILALLKENRSGKEVARILGRGATTISSVAARHDIKLPRKRRKPTSTSQNPS